MFAGVGEGSEAMDVLHGQRTVQQIGNAHVSTAMQNGGMRLQADQRPSTNEHQTVSDTWRHVGAKKPGSAENTYVWMAESVTREVRPSHVCNDG